MVVDVVWCGVVEEWVGVVGLGCVCSGSSGLVV